MGKIITVNGVEYERIEHEAKPSKKRSSKLWAIASMMAFVNPYVDYGSSYSRSLPSNIDIVKEFELIQQKKSNLSRWERDQVVRIFNQNFKQCS